MKKNKKKIVVISSCLIGMKTTYRGKSNCHREFLEMMKTGVICIPVCPEILGGLSTPRLPSEIQNGSGSDVIERRSRVRHNDGTDVTLHYLRGAREVLRLVRLVEPDIIIFKERSPSCGVHQIYDGTFSHQVIEGEGVTTAILCRHGFSVFSEKDYFDFKKKEQEL